MAQYKAVGVSGNNSGFHQAFGNAVTDDDVTTPSAALALNDTLDLIRVPGGTKLSELWKYNGDMDTGTTLQYSLGYRTAQSDGVLAASTTYFAAAGATDLQAAVLQSAPTRYAFPAITFNEDVFITMTVTAAATGVSGTPSITMKYLGKMVGIK
jgi:hypothetical protein